MSTPCFLMPVRFRNLSTVVRSILDARRGEVLHSPTRGALCALILGGIAMFSVDFAHAKDIYVAQTARGNDTGADATNAHSVAWLNASANWGLGGNRVSPGDTVHFNGNITSTVATQAGGNEGNVITILLIPALLSHFGDSCWRRNCCRPPGFSPVGDRMWNER